jgi:hypothetical protein
MIPDLTLHEVIGARVSRLAEGPRKSPCALSDDVREERNGSALSILWNLLQR